MKFIKELFDNDRLVASFFFACLLCLLMATVTLININHKLRNERLIERTRSINITEAHEELNEAECLSAQLRCYRDSIGMTEDYVIKKCREIDFCLTR